MPGASSRASFTDLNDGGGVGTAAVARSDLRGQQLTPTGVLHCYRAQTGIASELGEFSVCVEMASACEWFWRRGCSSQFGPAREDREATTRTQNTTALTQHANGVGEEEEHDRHRHGRKGRILERQILGLGQHDRRTRRALACERDHLFTVVQTSRAGAFREGVPKQKTAAATQVEHVVTGAERQGVEDCPPGELVNVFSAIDLSCPQATRPSRHTVGQPINKRIIRHAARAPGSQILVAEAKFANRLLMTTSDIKRHGARSYRRASLNHAIQGSTAVAVSEGLEAHSKPPRWNRPQSRPGVAFGPRRQLR